MRKASLATIIDGANIRPAIASPFSRRTARNLPVFSGKYGVDRQPRPGLLAVAGILPSVHRSAESASIGEVGAPVAAALQELTGAWTTEVLPALRSLFLDGLEPSGPVPESIKSFVAARQLSDHPVAVQSY